MSTPALQALTWWFMTGTPPAAGVTPIGVQNTATATAAGVVTVGVPTGTANGQGMALAVIYNLSASATITAPTGWTTLHTANTTAVAVGFFARIASSEPASYTINTNANNRVSSGTAAIVTFTHTSATSLVDGTSVQASYSGQTSEATGSYTPSSSTDAVIAMWLVTNSVTFTITSPFTLAVQATQTGGPSLAIAYANPGSTSAITATATLSVAGTTSDSSIVGFFHS